jgi:hypothetical protein
MVRDVVAEFLAELPVDTMMMPDDLRMRVIRDGADA